MDAAFFNAVRGTLFGGSLTQHQVDVLEAIIEAWHRYGDGDKRKLAYLLATAHHETGRFRWLKEIWGPTAAQKRYEGRADLGNTIKGDGHRFMGRGLVHITGRRNYSDWAKRLGIDIVANPALAERLDIAARILVQGCMIGTFTGKKLGDYINAYHADYASARRVVNGTDKQDLIAGYAREYEDALEGADLTPAKPTQPQKPSPVTERPEPDDSQPKAGVAGLVTVILAAVAAITAKIAGVF